MNQNKKIKNKKIKNKKIFKIAIILIVIVSSATYMLATDSLAKGGTFDETVTANITPIGLSTPYTFNVDRQYTFVKPGETAQYILTINNIGGITDTYNLSVDNPNSADIILSNENVTVDTGANKSIILNVASSVTGTYTVNVTAHPKSDPIKTITTNTYVDIANISEFNVENGITNGFIKTNVIVENRDNQSHMFAIMVNGIINVTTNNSTNLFPIIGTGIARIDARQTVKVPVLVSVSYLVTPLVETKYELYADLYGYDDQVFDVQKLIDRTGPRNNTDLITIKGYIRYSTIEGGCTYLEGDDGKNYELYKGNLPPTGTYVSVEGKIRNDMASICMIGQILEVISINEIK